MQEKGVDTPAKFFIRIYDTQRKLLSTLYVTLVRKANNLVTSDRLIWCFVDRLYENDKVENFTKITSLTFE